MALEMGLAHRGGDRRYVIIGAGAIGGAVGAVLARAGIPTVLVARGRHAEILATILPGADGRYGHVNQFQPWPRGGFHERVHASPLMNRHSPAATLVQSIAFSRRSL